LVIYRILFYKNYLVVGEDSKRISIFNVCDGRYIEVNSISVSNTKWQFWLKISLICPATLTVTTLPAYNNMFTRVPLFRTEDVFTILKCFHNINIFKESDVCKLFVELISEGAYEDS